MRPSAIPVMGMVAFFLVLATTTDAGARFGPRTALRAVAGTLGATLAGVRPSSAKRHHRARPADRSNRRRVQIAAAAPIMVAQLDRNAPTDRNVFWPYASDDLLEYAFFPKGKDERFWSYGFDAIIDGAFVADTAPTRRTRRSGEAPSEGSNPSVSGAADPCGSGRAADSADGMVERIAQAIRPSESQRDVLERLRADLARAIDRIKAACPTTEPKTLTERLTAMQDRIWAIRDALLSIRLPSEELYGSLADEQLWRLASADPDTTDGSATTGSIGAQSCAEQASGGSDWRIRAIERALRPTEQQRPMLQQLQMHLAGMAQLIGSTCPTYPLLGPMGRLSAAGDRLDVMLFAVMTLSPALPDFYESLSDKQKAGLARAIRQFRRATL